MKNKGITLVALVITIIILLILAGITIAQLTGSGLFENARKAESEYEISEAIESIELAIMSMNIDYLSKGKKITLSDLSNLSNYNDKIIQVNVDADTAYVNYDGKLTFEVNESLEISYSGESNGVIVTAKLSNENGWVTNLSDGIIISGKTKVSDGNIAEAIILLNGTKIADLTIEEDGTYSYTAKEDGTYRIQVTDSNGNMSYRDIEVKMKEDNVVPQDFTPTAKYESGNIVITSNAIDNETGIDYCTYSVKMDSVEKNSDLNNNTVPVTAYGEYQIEVTAYDKSGNSKVSSITFTVENPYADTLGDAILTDYYGTIVSDYAPTGGTEWKLFYADNENAYLISNPVSVPKVKQGDTISELGMALNSKFINWTSDAYSVKTVKWLTNTNEWTDYATDYAKWAIGATSIELFVKSYNATHTNQIELDANDIGYRFKWSTDANYTVELGGFSSTSDLDQAIYANTSYTWWFSSPSAAGESQVSRITNVNIMNYHIYTAIAINGVRPIACIPSSMLKVNSDGTGLVIE